MPRITQTNVEPGEGRTQHSLRRRLVLGAAAAVTIGLAIAGCGTNSGSGNSSSSSGDAKINVVASTNVYGSIASLIGKDRVSVTSIINDPNQDPHEFESSPQTKLAVSKGTVLIANGGGYDDFFTKLAQSVGDKTVINVVDLSGLKTSENADEFNEHVWYNMPAMGTLADKLAADFSAADSAHKSEFEANAASFKAALQKISDKESALASKYKGTPVAITEPVSLWMLEASGLKNETPHEFSEAVEDGNDAPASVVKEAQDQISGKKVKFLAFNSQAADAQSESLKKAADAANVPVIGFTETLPKDVDYLQWMNSNIDAIEKVLS